MGENEQDETKGAGPEEAIAAFDRERQKMRELQQRHADHVRASRAHDKPVRIERRKHPR